MKWTVSPFKRKCTPQKVGVSVLWNVTVLYIARTGVSGMLWYCT